MRFYIDFDNREVYSPQTIWSELYQNKNFLIFANEHWKDYCPLDDLSEDIQEELENIVYYKDLPEYIKEECETYLIEDYLNVNTVCYDIDKNGYIQK